MDRLSSGPLCLLLLASLVCMSFGNVADIARDMKIHFYLINHNPGGSYYAAIIIKNDGSTPFTATGWSLNFCHENLIEFERFHRGTGRYLRPTRRGGMDLTHVSGCMYKLTPDRRTFGSIAPQTRRQIVFKAAACLSGKWDIYPNFYISNETQTAVVSNTKDNMNRDFVLPFSNYFQYSRNPLIDPMLPVSPPRRYHVLVNQTYPALTPGDIIPTPYYKIADTREINMDTTWQFSNVDNDSRLNDLMKYFSRTLGIAETRDSIAYKVISVKLVKPKLIRERMSSEWYNITTVYDQLQVLITGHTTHGILNAFQTILNLITMKEDAYGNGLLVLPSIHISDSPRFSYRGLQLNVADNFVKPSTLGKLLSVMALLKLNKLQLILGGEYGIRLEIEGMKQFYTVGSKRCHDETEEKCLFSQLGSDPDGEGVGSGYFTVAEYKALLVQARDLHIEIIPSWCFDSSMRASEIAIKAYTKATGDQSMNWTLPILDDRMIRKPNMYKEGKVDPCATETFTFIRRIVSTIRRYHQDAGTPLKTFGVCGDDTDIDAWLEKCAARNMPTNRNHPFVHRKVQFATELSKIAIENQVTLNAYDNLFTAFPTNCTNKTECPDWFVPFNLTKWFPLNFNSTVTHRDPRVMFLTRLRYRESAINSSSLDRETKLRRFQKNGYKSILSLMDVHALDVKEEPGPDVPGELPCGRTPIPLQDIFSFWPEAMCCSRYECHHYTHRFGYRYVPGSPQPLCLEDHMDDGPLGMQATLSTVKVLDEDYMFQLMFPRLVAFAERAWHRAPWENVVRNPDTDPAFNMTAAAMSEINNYLKFKAILSAKVFPMLDRFQVGYILSPPGILLMNVTAQAGRSTILDRTIQAKTEYPDHVAQVKSPTMTAFEDIVPGKVYTGLILSFRTRTKSTDWPRYSRVVNLNIMEPDPYSMEHMAIMRNFTRDPELRFPIQTLYESHADATGQEAFAITHNLPMYFDTDFGLFFNVTGHRDFLLNKPRLLNERRQLILLRQQQMDVIRRRMEAAAAAASGQMNARAARMRAHAAQMRRAQAAQMRAQAAGHQQPSRGQSAGQLTGQASGQMGGPADQVGGPFQGQVPGHAGQMTGQVSGQRRSPHSGQPAG